MERCDFIRLSGLACLAMAVTGTGLAGCGGARYVSGTLNGEDMSVPMEALHFEDGRPKPYVVVRHPQLKWPVALYRMDDGTYRALLMRCTHQGAQLKVGDGELTCAAHGSAFGIDGSVVEGPAKEPLRRLPTRSVGDQLFISLKA